MKKTISLALILCMLMSVALPMSISAAPAVPTDPAKTSDFWNEETNLGWDAYPGSATIDGKWDENDDWSNALPLTLNATSKALLEGWTLGTAYDGDLYMLWDEKGLYILEVQRVGLANNIKAYSALTVSEFPTLWGGTNGNNWGTQYNILPDGEFNMTDVSGWCVAPYLYATDSEGNAIVNGTAYDAVPRARKYTYTSKSGARSWTVETVDETAAGVTSKFTVVSDTLAYTETMIKWDYLNITAPSANATEDIENVFGINVYMGKGGGNILSGLSGGTADTTGHAPVNLKANATTVKSTVNEAIDTEKAAAYWSDATTGVFFTHNDGVYEISTAEQLLGLSYAMELNGTNLESDKAWTQGKTFVLTNDIDLNPGVNWERYNQTKLGLTVDIDNVCEYMATAGAMPVNVWQSLDAFWGTFDGQGHTISGVYAEGAPQAGGNSTTVWGWGVFGGHAYRGSAVKNVVLDNGYIAAPSNRGVGAIFGVIRHSAGTDDKTTLDDGVLIENVYVGKNFTIDLSKLTSDTQSGGLVTSVWHEGNSTAGDDGILDVTFRNAVFGGHLQASAASQYDGVILGQSKTSSTGSGNTYKYNVNMTDCVVTGTYSGDTTAPHFVGTTSNCKNFGNGAEQAVPTGCEGKWVETAEGVMPVTVADMLVEYYYQASVAADGKYSVRIIGETAALDYKSIDFKVKITKADGSSAEWGYGVTTSSGASYQPSGVVYSSILANNQTKTAADLNKGVLDGANNNLYVLTLNGLDADEVHTIEISTVWTLTDGTVVEGGAVKTIVPAPWSTN